MTGSALEIIGLTASFGTNVLFRELSLSVRAGESVALTGPSGVGKTTLLNCILGVVRPESGRIVLAGHDITTISGAQLAQLRSADIGIVFQSGELLGELSPLENVALPALIACRDPNEAFESAEKLLTQVGVPLDRATADQLSGGERQRTALARALINEPTVVLADEPTGSLDPATRDRVADVLFEAPARWGCGLLVATHDPVVAARATSGHALHALPSLA